MKKNRLMIVLAFVVAAGLRAAGIVTYATDPNNHSSTPLPTRPGYLQSYTDPDFGTTVTRITDSTTATDGSTNLSNGVNWGNSVYNHYTKTQPWNADMSRIILNNENRQASPSTGSLSGPSPKRLILDGNTYAFVEGLDFSLGEYRWHPTDPNILFYTNLNQLLKFDFSTHTSTLIHTFSKYPATSGAITIGASEGAPSADGRWIALMAAYGGGNDAFAYDTTVLPPGDGTVNVVNLPSSKVDSRTGTSYSGPDWVSMSPSGNYIVVQWDDAFSEVYDRSMTLQQTVSLSGLSHYDMKLEGGVDYGAGVHKNPGSGGFVYKAPLIGSTSTQLVDKGYAAHTSARNYNYPGWVYTNYGENSNTYPFSNEICAIDLNSTSTSTTRRLGHFFNVKLDYRNEVHAVPSPDGMRIIFQSNWGNRGGNGRGTDTYVIDLRSLLPFNDDFETNNFSSVWTVNSSSYVFRSSTAGHGSTYGMRMKGNAGGTINDRSHAYLTNNVSTVGYTKVVVQYDIMTVGLTSGHKFYLDWYDGTNWTLGADAVDATATSWGTRTITLPAGAAGQAGFKIEFRTDATATSEYANIDRVKVIGQ
jgi:hypothetical protein